MSIHRILAHRYGILDPSGPEEPLRLVRAADSLEKAEVFLFFFPRDLGPREAVVRREIRERGERLRRNPHPLFLNVLDVQEDAGLLFLVEERPLGETLLSRIRDRRRTGNVFSLQEALGLCGLLCRAVDSMQPFLGHGFLNPQEVFLEPWEGGPLPFYPKVAHTGVRACLRCASAALEGLEEEARLYAAPEFVGREAITGATDCYGIAALLYSMLTMHPPTGCFHRPSVIHPGFPAALEGEILRALEENPRQRCASPGALLETLKTHTGAEVPWEKIETAESCLCRRHGRAPRAVANGSSLRRHPGKPEGLSRDLPARSRPLLAVVCLVLLSAVLLGFGIWELRSARLQGESRLLELRGWELRFLESRNGEETGG